MTRDLRTAILGGGFGLGLLLASAFSSFLGSWAVGALLLTSVVLSAALLVARAESAAD